MIFWGGGEGGREGYSGRHIFRAIVGFSKLGKIFVSFDPNELATSSFFY